MGPTPCSSTKLCTSGGRLSRAPLACSADLPDASWTIRAHLSACHRGRMKRCRETANADGSVDVPAIALGSKVRSSAFQQLDIQHGWWDGWVGGGERNALANSSSYLWRRACIYIAMTDCATSLQAL